MRLAAHLPLAVLHALGAVLGWVIYLGSAAYRRNLRANLAAAGYPDAATRRAAIASAGRMLAELPALWFRPHAGVVRLVREVEGAEAARAALREGRPVVFLTPHMGCYEITSLYAALESPITILYREPKIAALAPLMREGRERSGVRLVTADLVGVRELMQALARREAAGFLPDQVPSVGEGEWTAFFGRPAYTMTLAARLAARPGVLCLLAWGERLPRGRGYRIHVRPLPEPLAGESPARRMNRALEALIRECPGQYLWGYNRYKVPKGVAPPPAAVP